MEEKTTRTAPVIGVSRLRMNIDGEGVTTLVGFYGCPLRCKWCINPACFTPRQAVRMFSPEKLYAQVRQDELYYLATGGGVTFGGGEPLQFPWFLTKFRKLCGDAWHLCAETSLAVPWENVREAAESIDEFIVDCKDTDPNIYLRYTGRSNDLALENLRKLVALVGAERVLVRVPLIPQYNTEQDCAASEARLREMGVERFDRFAYMLPDEKR